MRKILIFILILISIIFIGCSSEPRYTAEEWNEIIKEKELEQEQSEFQKEKEKIIKFDKKLNEIKLNYENAVNKIGDKIKTGELNSDETQTALINILDDLLEDLKDIEVPYSLDDFYDKKIELFSKLRNSVNGIDESKADELDLLKIESDRIQREVYRKYDLEYLLK
jgi:hypothetical protein